MNLVLYRLVILSSNNVHSLTESNHGTTLRALLLGRTCYAYWIHVVSSTYCYQQSFQPTFFSFLFKLIPFDPNRDAPNIDESNSVYCHLSFDLPLRNQPYLILGPA